MCQACIDSVATHLPKVSEADRFRLLMGATAFGCAGVEYVVEQVVELSKKTDGTLKACLAFADAETDRQMAEFNQNYGAEGELCPT